MAITFFRCFVNIPLKKVIAFIWTNPLEQGSFRPSLGEIDPVVLKKKIVKFFNISYLFCIISLWKSRWSFFRKVDVNCDSEYRIHNWATCYSTFRSLMNPDFIWIAVAIILECFIARGRVSGPLCCASLTIRWW